MPNEDFFPRTFEYSNNNMQLNEGEDTTERKNLVEIIKLYEEVDKNL